MFSFRSLLTKGGLRTPLLVSVAIIGSDRYFAFKRRESASGLWSKGVSRTPFGLRSVYLSGNEKTVKTVQDICKEKFPAVVAVRQQVKSDKDADIWCHHNTSSGFFISQEKVVLILTTARAVGNAKVVEVYNKEGEYGYGFSVVLYIDPTMDLALLSRPFRHSVAIDPVDYSGKKERVKMPAVGPNVQPTVLTLADGDVQYAQDVVALGSAWDYNTVSKGIISHPNRSGDDITKIGKKYPFITETAHYLQHTASFAFDDYGGALVNMKGDVVGMYFYLQLIDNIVMYFAIKTKDIKKFIADAKAYQAILGPEECQKRIATINITETRRSPFYPLDAKPESK
ncbi:unnamed protein product [Medioppia subpectinata]|uniref:Uncharacterized protein n=1 Tax=Medioppia subpectinata TaxID=1979941 RepID=A0A7R9KML7_9ACAR|nr:unnamed protein product [Medioppia subpectinata]CAG2105328.1 unnamed protein product [Medioppia subpectinata]